MDRKNEHLDGNVVWILFVFCWPIADGSDAVANGISWGASAVDCYSSCQGSFSTPQFELSTTMMLSYFGAGALPFPRMMRNLTSSYKLKVLSCRLCLCFVITMKFGTVTFVLLLSFISWMAASLMSRLTIKSISHLYWLCSYWSLCCRLRSLYMVHQTIKKWKRKFFFY